MIRTDAAPAGQAAAVEISTPARLHLGMLSFGMPGVRSYGGVGVMIDRPGVRLRMTRSAEFTAVGPQGERAVAFARECGRAWSLGDAAACGIEVLSVPAGHAGLGSGTQLGLAVAAGMRHLFLAQAAAAADGVWRFRAEEAVALARGVGRGRRSCVGIYGFGGGGLIVEGGRLVPLDRGPEDDATRPFSPLVARVLLPEAWRCVVFTLRNATGLHGDAEKQAFASLPPVPLEISAELSRIAVLELVPAAVEGRFAAFSEAVFRYGRLAGAPFEPVSAGLPHAAITARLIDTLVEIGCSGVAQSGVAQSGVAQSGVAQSGVAQSGVAQSGVAQSGVAQSGVAQSGVAQSSWGPTVMACCESAAAAAALVARFAAGPLAEDYETTVASFDHQGAVLREITTDQARPTGRP